MKRVAFVLCQDPFRPVPKVYSRKDHVFIVFVRKDLYLRGLLWTACCPTIHPDQGPELQKVSKKPSKNGSKKGSRKKVLKKVLKKGLKKGLKKKSPLKRAQKRAQKSLFPQKRAQKSTALKKVARKVKFTQKSNSKK